VVYRSNLLFIIVTFGGIVSFLAAVFTAIFLFFLIIIIFVVIAFNVLETVVVFKVRQRLDFRLEARIRESLDKVL
jgi:hypothetical protein